MVDAFRTLGITAAVCMRLSCVTSCCVLAQHSVLNILFFLTIGRAFLGALHSNLGVAVSTYFTSGQLGKQATSRLREGSDRSLS